MTQRKTTHAAAPTTSRSRPVASAASEPAPFVPPYSLSWFDRLEAWVDRLPGPFWLAYLFLWIGLYAIETILHWQAGAAPIGTWNPLHGILTAVVPGCLCLLHALDHLAERSFDSFRPVLRANDAEAQNLRYQLTVLPQRTFAVVALAFIVFGAVVFLSPAAGADAPLVAVRSVFGDLQLSPSPAPAAFTVLLMIITWASVGLLVYHTVRQLRWVSRLYTGWTHVDLLKPGPLYSLSRISAGTALSLIVLIYLILAADRRYFSDPRNLVGAGVFALLAMLAFVLPLLGVHRALVAEKERLLDESADRMKASLAELHHRVDRKNLRDMDALNKAIASLEIERNLLNRIPTWPWQPESLRTVIVALLLPIVIWLVQQVLQPLLARS
jgi:hypothetical protein